MKRRGRWGKSGIGDSQVLFLVKAVGTTHIVQGLVARCVSYSFLPIGLHLPAGSSASKRAAGSHLQVHVFGRTGPVLCLYESRWVFNMGKLSSRGSRFQRKSKKRCVSCQKPWCNVQVLSGQGELRQVFRIGTC